MITLVSGQTLSSLGDHFVTDGISGGVSLLSTAGNGNLVVVVVYGDDGTGTGDVTSVVDDNGAYTLGRAQQNDIVGLFVEIWYRVMTSGAGGGQNIVVTLDAAYSSANNIIAAMELTGVANPQASLSSNSVNTGPSTTHASGTVLPGATENVVVAVAAGSNRTWTNDPDSWTNLTTTGRAISSFKIQATDTLQEYNVTQDTDGYAASAIVAFKGSGAAVSLPVGSLVVTGRPVGIGFTGPSVGAVVVTGYAPIVSIAPTSGLTIATPQGTLVVTGRLVGIGFIGASRGALVITGRAPTVSIAGAGMAIGLPVGSVPVTGGYVGVSFLQPTPGALGVTGYAPGVGSGDISLPKGALVLTGRALTVSIFVGNNITIPVLKGALGVTGRTPTPTVALGPSVLAIPKGTIGLTGYVVTIAVAGSPSLQARANIMRAGVTYAGLCWPNLRVYIRGVDRTDDILQTGEFVLVDRRDGLSTLSFSVLAQAEDSGAMFDPLYFDPLSIDTASTTSTVFVLADFDDVQVTYATPNELWFAGTILQREAVPEDNTPGHVIWRCTAASYDWLADRYDLVLARFRALGINTILAQLAAFYTDGGFTKGYVPESLGNETITADWEPVTSIARRLAASTETIFDMTPEKTLNLYDTPAIGNLPTLVQSMVVMGTLVYRRDGSQVRTRTVTHGRGSSVSALTSPGATSIQVVDTEPFLSTGGRAFSGMNRISYTGTSVGAGPGFLTGVTGFTGDDLAEGDELRVESDETAAEAVTALATALGGGLSGQASHRIDGGGASATETLARSNADTSTFGNALPELEFTYKAVHRTLRAGMLLPVNITDPIVIEGTFRVQTVTTTIRGQVGGTFLNLFQTVTASRFTRRVSDLLRQLRG